MKLELKAIEYSERLSEETYCFSAKLYVDGKPFAIVSNRGHGGCTDVDPINFEMEHVGAWRTHLEEVEAYIKANFPATTYEDVVIHTDLEIWASDQITEHLYRKEMKTAFRSKVLFYVKGSVRYFAKKQKGRTFPQEQIVEHVRSRHGDDVKILNLLPEAEALELWKANAA